MSKLVLVVLIVMLISCEAFLVPNRPMSYLAITKPSPNVASSRRDMKLYGGKMSKFGVFSPAVYAAKLILGESKLNKIRGKAISLHSQAITEWCKTYGAYNLRTRLIKKAKKNGDELGFLV
jgi:hypothetical protein